MSGHPLHAGPEETMEAEAQDLATQKPHAGTELTMTERHVSTRTFLVNNKKVLATVAEAGLVCSVSTVIHHKSRIRSHRQATPGDIPLSNLEGHLDAFFNKLPSNHFLKKLATRIDENKITWGLPAWADTVTEIYDSIRTVPSTSGELRKLVMFIAEHTHYPNISSGGGSSSSNPGMAMSGPGLVDVSQHYFYNVPGTYETVKDSEEWMPDEIKMCQFNGLLIMVDLYNTCWSDAFYSLINLAHFAKTGRNVQQGTVEAEMRFRDQILMVEDPRGYVIELLDCIKGRHLQKAPTLELKGLSLQVSSAVAKQQLQEVAAGLQQAGEERAARGLGGAAAGGLYLEDLFSDTSSDAGGTAGVTSEDE